MTIELYQLEEFLLNDDPRISSWEFVGTVMEFLASHNLDITINKYVATNRVPERCSIVVYDDMIFLVDMYVVLTPSSNLPKIIAEAAFNAVTKLKSV